MVPTEGSQVAQASLLQPAPPQVQAPPALFQVATLTFVEEALSPVSGFMVAPLSPVSVPNIATVTASPNTTNTVTVPLPSGTVAAGFTVPTKNPSGVLGVPVAISIIGHQTGIAYVNNRPPPPRGTPIAVAIDQNDTSIDVSVTAPVGNTAAIDVLSWATFPSYCAPDPQSAPNQPPISFAVTLVPNTPFNLIPANANRQVFLHTFACSFDATAAGGLPALQDTGGVNLYQMVSNNTVTPPPMDFKGAPVNFGAGVQLNNPGAVNVILRGTLNYSFG